MIIKAIHRILYRMKYGRWLMMSDGWFIAKMQFKLFKWRCEQNKLFNLKFFFFSFLFRWKCFNGLNFIGGSFNSSNWLRKSILNWCINSLQTVYRTPYTVHNSSIAPNNYFLLIESIVSVDMCTFSNLPPESLNGVSMWYCNMISVRIQSV